MGIKHITIIIYDLAPSRWQPIPIILTTCTLILILGLASFTSS